MPSYGYDYDPYYPQRDNAPAPAPVPTAAPIAPTPAPTAAPGNATGIVTSGPTRTTRAPVIPAGVVSGNDQTGFIKTLPDGTITYPTAGEIEAYRNNGVPVVPSPAVAPAPNPVPTFTVSSQDRALIDRLGLTVQPNRFGGYNLIDSSGKNVGSSEQGYSFAEPSAPPAATSTAPTPAPTAAPASGSTDTQLDYDPYMKKGGVVKKRKSKTKIQYKGMTSRLKKMLGES
jgi:hypothetical protein